VSQADVITYLVNLSKQKKNRGILNLQIVFVTYAKEGVCHRSCLKKKIIIQKLKKKSVLYLAQLKMIDFTPIYFPYKAKKL
jgi:hypothetical protein